MRILVSTIAILGAARAAHADPAPPDPAPAVAAVAAQLQSNNLHIGVQCAYYLATPDEGLRVTIDGARAQPFGVNGETEVGYTKHGTEVDTWVPTDVGFGVPFGRHHLTIETPDCATDTRDLDVGPVSSVGGRLVLDTPYLKGTVGAPNGFGLTIAATAAFQPNVTSTHAGTVYASNGGSLDGVTLATSLERRHVVFSSDLIANFGTASGTSTQTTGNDAGVGRPFSTTDVQIRERLRIGARLPLNVVSLAAGTGLGGEIEIDGSSNPEGAHVDWFVPLWASITFKPDCNWGVQALASYDLRPGAPSASELSFAAGVIIQPSASCSEPAGVTVH